MALERRLPALAPLREANVVVIGTPIGVRLGYGNPICPETQIIRVDVDYAGLGRNCDIDIMGGAGQHHRWYQHGRAIQ